MGKTSTAKWPSSPITLERKLEAFDKIRMARNVKVCTHIIIRAYQLIIQFLSQIITESQSIDFAEVFFYFQFSITVNGERKNETYALVSRYSPPHAEILKKSHNTYWSCTHGKIEDMEIIPVKTILSAVSIIPHNLFQDDSEQRYFVVERPGLEVAHMGGVEESILDEL